MVEPIAPDVNLSSSTTVQFNQTAISNSLSFNYTINSLSATVSTATLEWRRNNTGSWTSLSTSTTTPGTFSHSLTDSSFNGQPFNYRYTVVDSFGATNIAYKNITPVAYSSPSITLTVAAVSSSSPETAIKRERGNIDTDLTGNIVRNSPLVDLSTYTLQYSLNNSTWVDIGSAVSIGPGTTSISSTNHNDAALFNSAVIYYRVKVIDTYQTSISNFVSGGNKTVNFLYMIFYGPSSSIPSTSSDVRALGSRIFTDGSNPFLLNTGNTEVNFTASMPATLTISNVIDLDALSANITSLYTNNLSTFDVQDAYGTNVSYNNYTMTNASVYSANHRHQITR